jgi:hypothetical protein
MPTELHLNLHGVVVGVVDTVDAEFLVELGTLGRVTSIEGRDQSTGLLEECSSLLGG